MQWRCDMRIIAKLCGCDSRFLWCRLSILAIMTIGFVVVHVGYVVSPVPANEGQEHPHSLTRPSSNTAVANLTLEQKRHGTITATILNGLQQGSCLQTKIVFSEGMPVIIELRGAQGSIPSNFSKEDTVHMHVKFLKTHKKNVRGLPRIDAVGLVGYQPPGNTTFLWFERFQMNFQDVFAGRASGDRVDLRICFLKSHFVVSDGGKEPIRIRARFDWAEISSLVIGGSRAQGFARQAGIVVYDCAHVPCTYVLSR
mmetsp:Transcript_34341/g.84475  ORF Transcript_34341/g.84475 Transcript_34341/m.84475 type:complete len:255 (-) Transcript_34341:3087-3851(-)